ncbi:MAG: phosphotransferase family protein [Chloroflexi bacterium]|nr:phosphotransferase family protein [Chloroflexota bacterium]
MSLTLEQALARVPMWQGIADLKSTPLGGGITNRNFRVDAGGGESFVLRIGGQDTELLGINRANEFAANVAAARIGVAPEVVYFIEPEGYLVTRFLAARPLPREEIGKPENIRRVAETLKRIHAMPAIPGTFSPFRMVEDYAATARRYTVQFPDNFDWLMARMNEIETAFLRDPFTPHPCHNDLLNENFLDDGALRIIDWEYAGMGDIVFDLANFAVHHGFSDEQDQFLLQCYFGEATSRRMARHKLMKIASDCREAMWGMVQIGISKLDFDFRAYADKHFNRMAEMIRDKRYVDWVKEF